MINENTCLTCKFWRRIAESIQSPWGEYVKLDHAFLGDCLNPKIFYGHPGEQDGLNYWDDEGGGGYFCTGQDFGCIHHQS